MSHTKTIEVKTNWLDQVDGKTVADAIKYLSTLNQSHRLSYNMEGDTHGCSVKSCLTYVAPKSNAEILAELEKRYLTEIASLETAMAKHVAESRAERADSCARRIAQLQSLHAEAKVKYDKK
jgi:excinuclease UvrABC nuclease subunit